MGTNCKTEAPGANGEIEKLLLKKIFPEGVEVLSSLSDWVKAIDLLIGIVQEYALSLTNIDSFLNDQELRQLSFFLFLWNEKSKEPTDLLGKISFRIESLIKQDVAQFEAMWKIFRGRFIRWLEAYGAMFPPGFDSTALMLSKI